MMKRKSWPPRVRTSLMRFLVIFLCAMGCWLALYLIRSTIFNGQQTHSIMLVFTYISKIIVALALFGFLINIIRDVVDGLMIVPGGGFSVYYKEQSPIKFFFWAAFYMILLTVIIICFLRELIFRTN
jgi:hypothetical protein